MKHTVYSKVLNGQLEYAFNKDSILQPQMKLYLNSTASEELSQLRKGVN
jgi:hypothetical protein